MPYPIRLLRPPFDEAIVVLRFLRALDRASRGRGSNSELNILSMCWSEQIRSVFGVGGTSNYPHTV